jgi:hypothetical protein
MLTNDRVSDIFWLGGHIAWGVGDRKVKYGGEAGLTLYRPGDINLRHIPAVKMLKKLEPTDF